jgi:uncharacterized membrane protein
VQTAVISAIGFICVSAVFMFDSVSFLRAIKTGLTNFVRNLWLSMAATMVMTITLVILSTLFLLFVLTNYSIKTIQNTVDISVYFKIGLAEDQINNIKNQITQDQKVKEVSYVSAAQAFQDFKSKHENDPLITQSLNELTENPLPATLHIKANELQDYPAIAERLQTDQYANFIDKVNFEDNRLVIERLNKILKFIVTFGVVLVVIFALIAILVIYNTITLTFYMFDEIFFFGKCTSCIYDHIHFVVIPRDFFWLVSLCCFYYFSFNIYSIIKLFYIHRKCSVGGVIFQKICHHLI